MAFNSFFMAMKKHLIFMSGDSKFQAFLMVYFNAFFMEWNFSWPRKKSWKVQKLMAMIFLMAFSLFVRRNGTSHANAMNFVQKKWKFHEKCPYKKPSFFTRSSCHSNLRMYYSSYQYAISSGQKNQQVDLSNV